MNKNVLISKYPMIEMDEAFRLIKTRLENMPKTTLSIDTLNANNFITAEDVHAPVNIPSRYTSVMDGYAMDYKSIDRSQTLTVLGEIYAGDLSLSKPTDMTNRCYYITTGAPLPDGCNCIVPVERVEQVQKHKVIKLLNEAVLEDMYYVRNIGSDVRKGELVLEKDKIITIADISVLASLGVKTAKVYRLPTIGILSTGNEVCELDKFDESKVVDTNRITIKLILQSVFPGVKLFDFKIISDDMDSIKSLFEDNIKGSVDILISSGGVSMGERDLIKKFLEEHGEVVFGRLHMKPGKPTTFAMYRGIPIMALPGNPVSFTVCTYLFVLKMIYLFQNFDYSYPTIHGKLLHDYKLDMERPEYTRGM
jgi:molybdenum cofactor synthesis domain-containing protein